MFFLPTIFPDLFWKLDNRYSLEIKKFLKDLKLWKDTIAMKTFAILTLIGLLLLKQTIGSHAQHKEVS